MIEWPCADGTVAVGDHVRDRERPIGTGTVLAVHDVPAREYSIDHIEKTVAKDNPNYPPGDPVVAVVWSVLDGKSDLATAWDEHTVYHFPVSRLVCESCVRDVAPDELGASPYHTRTFSWDENRNRHYIYGIREKGYIGSLVLVRETATGLELVAGHKRCWVVEKAGLETVAVRVVDFSEWEAAIHYAEDHLRSVDEEMARQIVQTLIARWGDRVFSVPSVAATIDRGEISASELRRQTALRSNSMS